VPPGGQAHLSLDLSAPATPGVYVSDWRLHDGRGRPLGDIIFTRIIAVAESPSDRGRSDARFVADITIPDDTRLAPGRQFTKTWRLANNGERAWGSGYRLLFVKGSPMTDRRAVPVPFAQPGAEVEIALPLTAPARPGTYFGDWQLADPDGNRFGDVVFLRIVVLGGG
jgi:next-to-BRCA1 protein 1